jgi:hypothetical protein
MEPGVNRVAIGRRVELGSLEELLQESEGFRPLGLEAEKHIEQPQRALRLR